MFDSVLLPCPNCGEFYEAQSKSGDCLLKIFTFDEALDDAVIYDVNRHAPYTCDKCGTIFIVKFTPTIIIYEGK